MSSVYEAVKILPDYWTRLVLKIPQRKLSIGVIAFFVVVFIYYLLKYPSEFSIWKLRWIVWGALFAGSVWEVGTPAGRAFFYLMIVAFIFINPILWFIPMLLLVYLVYKLLDRYRMYRLQQIADSTPEQLSGMSERPKIIIQIRKED